jgi:hypothetical protein
LAKKWGGLITRKAWAARGITPGRSKKKARKKSSAATKKANGKKITRMKNDGTISTAVATRLRTANKNGSIPMIRYVKHDQAGHDFAGEFIGPLRPPV